MIKYAHLVKNQDNVYEVFDVTAPAEERAARYEQALASGQPISGMKTSSFTSSACPEAVWDGANFSGGVGWNLNVPEENWDVTNTYSFLCNNKIVGMYISYKNSTQDSMLEAAFSEDVTIAKVPEGELVLPGQIWDGSNFSQNPNNV